MCPGRDVSVCLFRAQARGPRQASKGDINGTWQHDLFDGNKSLSARLSSSGAPPKMNMSLAERALREANGETGIAIKGASSRGNVVEISGLADGTTSADVEVRSCRLWPLRFGFSQGWPCRLSSSAVVQSRTISR